MGTLFFFYYTIQFFLQFKEQFDEEKKKLNTKINEFDDQGDRENVELRSNFAVKFLKLSDKNNKALKEVDFYKAKVKT